MTGFQHTPRVCPSDTQKLGFSYICSSSLSVLLISPSISLLLSASNGYTCSLCFYLNCDHVTLLSLQGRVSCVIISTEWNQKAQIFSFSCEVPVVYLERLRVHLQLYGSHCRNVTYFLVKWWLHVASGNSSRLLKIVFFLVCLTVFHNRDWPENFLFPSSFYMCFEIVYEILELCCVLWMGQG